MHDLQLVLKLFESFIVFRKRKLGFICDDIALILFISRKVADGDHNDGDEESKRDKLVRLFMLLVNLANRFKKCI
ncbi:hypothetical protein L1987_18126 [Smallanthus sonchifolius]|uniref:Uncharacterized protein n=1 Tax=Smallanthus sonchifolius TaxID=185202 RepID=A0ACB9IZE6_9ASTR|nr:hypothetical protein L1987_18126 [Smallanthus sonchifolius]